MNFSIRQLNYYRKLFRVKGLYASVGLVFIILFVVTTPVILLLPILLKEPFERYNYHEIIKKGEIHKAKIRSINIKRNITINGAHPWVIKYDYTNEPFSVMDQFQTIQVKQAEFLSKQDSIQVIVYKGQSVIKDIEPFIFPYLLFLLLPAFLLIFGAIAYGIGMSQR